MVTFSSEHLHCVILCCFSLRPSKRIGERKGFNTENYWLIYKWKLVLYSNRWLNLRIKFEKKQKTSKIHYQKNDKIVQYIIDITTAYLRMVEKKAAKNVKRREENKL